MPYAGLGIGRVNASVDYRVGSQRGRNHDSTGDLIVCLISFLTACGDGGTFHDELVGYRLFGGVDYATGRFAFDLRLGWMGMTPFEGQGSEDGVLYGLATGHLSSVFGSIGLSWRFLNWP